MWFDNDTVTKKVKFLNFQKPNSVTNYWWILKTAKWTEILNQWVWTAANKQISSECEGNDCKSKAFLLEPRELKRQLSKAPFVSLWFLIDLCSLPSPFNFTLAMPNHTHSLTLTRTHWTHCSSSRRLCPPLLCGRPRGRLHSLSPSCHWSSRSGWGWVCYCQRKGGEI